MTATDDAPTTGRHDPRASATVDVAVETMTAVLHDSYGTDPDEVLRLGRTDMPTVRDGQVLVRVQSAGVDRGTWHMMAGLPYPIRVAGFGLRTPKHLNPGQPRRVGRSGGRRGDRLRAG